MGRKIHNISKDKNEETMKHSTNSEAFFNGFLFSLIEN